MKIYRLLLILPLCFCCQKPVTENTDRLVVAAGIPPLADFVRQVGGDRVQVFSVVPSGANPHTFDLTPEHLRRLAAARLLVLNGIGLEYWADKISDNFPGLRVVSVSTGIPVLQDDDHAIGNPHVWLDPQYAMLQTEKICQALMDLDPTHSQTYRNNNERFQKRLADLDRQIAAEVNGWQEKSFICFHPSWNYFADRYHLIQAAVIEKRAGFEPSPGETAEIIEVAKKVKARAIFAELQFPIKVSEMIAQECGAQVLVLDPLGVDGPEYSYIALMQANLQKMAQALR